MTSSQLRDSARHYRDTAFHITGAANPAAAGELLRGAMDQLTRAVALHHGLVRGGRPLRRRPVLEWMDATRPDLPSLSARFPIIARLHGHFYNGNLSSQVLEYYSEGGLELIEDLLNHPLTLEIP